MSFIFKASAFGTTKCRILRFVRLNRLVGCLLKVTIQGKFICLHLLPVDLQLFILCYINSERFGGDCLKNSAFFGYWSVLTFRQHLHRVYSLRAFSHGSLCCVLNFAIQQRFGGRTVVDYRLDFLKNNNACSDHIGSFKMSLNSE